MLRSNHVPESQAERLTMIVLKAPRAFWLKSVPLRTPKLMYKSEAAAIEKTQRRSFAVGLKPRTKEKEKLTALWIIPTATHGRL